MENLKFSLIITVFLIINIINAARIPRQQSSTSNGLSQFGFIIDDDQIVRRDPNFIPGSDLSQPIGGGAISGTTTTTAGPPTTASPAFLACMERCRTTQEYNPVCGTDMINYHNGGKLACAQRCGKNVDRVRLGTCLPL